jgi:diacylglycerol kinase family enzyme
MTSTFLPTSASPQVGPRVVAVILNGAAGALLGRPDALQMLKAEFAANGFDPHFIPPEVGPLPERVAQAAHLGAEAVIVAGGDGTIACAAQALAETGIPLGVLPFGTMNLLAKDLGIPIGDLGAALRVLVAGRIRAIDVAEVDGRVFLCASMLGLPARLGRYREAQRGTGSPARAWSRMGWMFLRAIAQTGRMRVSVQIGDRTLGLRAASLTITVNALDDMSGRAFGRSRLDGGELAFIVIRRLTLVRIALLAIRVLRRDWRRDPGVQEYRTPELIVSKRGRAIQVMNDGELMVLEPPLHYRIRPGALLVIAP